MPRAAPVALALCCATAALALSLALSSRAAFAQATHEAPAPTASESECPEGLATVDREGHCCAPGQNFVHGACAGAPAVCPPGHTLGRAHGAAACVPRACEAGRERAADGVHCCFPGQSFREGACRGERVHCPAGTTPLGAHDCAPAVGVARARPTRAAPPGMVWVGGGTFVMGSRARPEWRYVTVGPFWIDRTEVTAAAYARCVAAGRCAAANESFAPEHAPANTPAVSVTHAMARSYCAFRGARLPTEAEWEFAARGADARSYPWGERAPDCSLARFAGCAPGAAPVGSMRAGASPVGALDMAGNVAEWTADRGGPAPPGGSDRDPVGPPRGETRVVRGGAFDSPPSALATTARVQRDPREARYDTGFRCVR